MLQSPASRRIQRGLFEQGLEQGAKVETSPTHHQRNVSLRLRLLDPPIGVFCPSSRRVALRRLDEIDPPVRDGIDLDWGWLRGADVEATVDLARVGNRSEEHTSELQSQS